jgi:hypothetical protein
LFLLLMLLLAAAAAVQVSLIAAEVTPTSHKVRLLITGEGHPESPAAAAVAGGKTAAKRAVTAAPSADPAAATSSSSSSSRSGDGQSVLRKESSSTSLLPLGDAATVYTGVPGVSCEPPAADLESNSSDDVLEDSDDGVGGGGRPDGRRMSNRTHSQMLRDHVRVVPLHQRGGCVVTEMWPEQMKEVRAAMFDDPVSE